MKRRNRFLLLAALICCLALFLYGCSTSTVTPEDPGENADPKPEITYNLTIANGNGIATSLKKNAEFVTVVADQPDNKLFLGWEYQGKIVTTSPEYSFTVTDDAVLRALYCDAYTIYLDRDGEGLAYEEITVGEQLSFSLPVLEKQHHIFLGWFENNRPFTDDKGQSLTPFSEAQNIILTPKFKEKTIYTVTIINNNGMQETEIVLHEGERVELRADVVVDMRCTGWSKLVGEELISVTEDSTYTFIVTEDATYQSTYRVAYKIDVSFGSGSKEYAYGETATISVSPPVGQRFLGWLTDGTIVSTEITYSFSVTKSQKFDPDFEKIKYSITYLLDGVSYGEIDYLEYKAPLVLREDPKRTHHVFGGWYINGQLSVPTKMLADNLVIRGSFTLEKHKLTVVDGSGSGTYDYGHAVSLTPVNKEHIGQRFLGWFTDDGSPILSSQNPYTHTLTQDIVITAKYELIKYVFKYEVKGGTYGTEYSIYEENHYNYNDVVKRVAPLTMEHYTFSGWGNIPERMPARDVTLRAEFIVHTHTLTVTGGYINGDPNLTAGTFDWNEEVTITAVLPIGESFVGWHNGNTVIGAVNPYVYHIPNNSVLTLVTQSINYFIHYELDGTPYESADSFHYGDEIHLKDPASKVHYRFIGWRQKGDNPIPPDTMPANDIYLEGFLILEKHTLTLINGTIVGSLPPASGGEFNYGTSVTVNANAIAGMTFLHWEDTSTNDIVSVEPEYVFDLKKDTSLTAVYEKTPYEIRYYVDGQLYHTVRPVFYNQPFSVLENPIKAHYTFSGWSLEGGASLPTVNPASDLNVYGTFAVKQYTLTVVGGTIDETSDTTVTVDYNTPFTVRPTLPVGHDFVSWKSGPNVVSLSDVYTFSIDKDLTLTANFKLSVYRVAVTNGNIVKVNDGIVPPASTGDYEYESTITVHANATPTGKRYLGWYDSNGTFITDQTRYVFDLRHPIELIAKFEAIDYTITYWVKSPGQTNAEIYTFGDGLINPVIANYKDSITTYTHPPAIPHYHFVGWKYNDISGADLPNTVIMPDHHIVAYGEYVIDTHQLTVNNGTGGGVFHYGAEVTVQPTIPVGQRFVNWTDGTSAVSTDKIYTFILEDETELTANFEAIDYTLTFTVFGAEYGTSGYVIQTSTLHYGDALPSFPVLDDKENFVFGAWSYNGGTDLPRTMPAEDVTITNEYLLIFVYETASDGTLSISANPATVGRYPESIVIPDLYEEKQVTTIASRGFSGIGNLKTIVVNNNIVTIGFGAFENTALMSLTLPFLGASAQSEHGFLGYVFGADNSLLQADKVPETLKDVVVKSVSLGDYAFYNLYNLTSISAPNTTSIGKDAFSGCTSLVSFVIPETVTSIGEGAFQNLIGADSIFYNAKSIDSVGSNTFTGLGKTQDFTVHIGREVIRIPNNLFYSDSSSSDGYNTLYGINFNSNALTSIGQNAFRAVRGLENGIALPNGLLTVGDNAFNGNYAHSIVLPYTLTAIGEAAFASMTSLNHLAYYPNIASIQSLAFHATGSSRAALTVGANVSVLPEGIFANSRFSSILFQTKGTTEQNGENLNASKLSIIGSEAFYGNSLIEVELPDALTEIGASAFQNNVTLASVRLNLSLTKLGSEAFADCANLTSVNLNSQRLDALNAQSNVFDNSGTGGLGIAVTVGRLTERIPAYLFHAKRTPKVISLGFVPNAVCTEIGKYAFSGASFLTSVTLAPTVTKIDEFAFSALGASEIVLPFNVEFIGSSAFADASPLTVKCEAASARPSWSVGWDNGISTVEYGINNVTDNADFDYVVYNNNVQITRWKSAVPDAVVPDTVNGSPVVDVGTSFAGLSISSVTLPTTVTKIYSYAFYNCGSLVTFNGSDIALIGAYAFAGNSSLSTFNATFVGTVLSESAFADCTQLTAFDFSTVTNIEASAFKNSGLVEINLSVAVSIGENAFSESTRLSLVTLPQGLTHIALNAFSSCFELTEITVASGNSHFAVTDGALYDLSTNTLIVFPAQFSVTSVVIADGTTAIAPSAFENASLLTSVTLPASVTTIGARAFYNTIGLTTLWYNATSVANLTAQSEVFGLAGTTQGFSATFGLGVQSLPDYLFYAESAVNLTELNIQSSSIRSIGTYAFYRLSMSEIVLPSDADQTTLGAYAFADNFGVSKLTYAVKNGVNLNATDGVFNNLGKDTASGAEIVVSQTVTKIPSNLFYTSMGDSKNVTVLTLPDVNFTIGSNAFRRLQITALVVPTHATDIGDYAFADNTLLTAITYHSSAEVGAEVFCDAGGQASGITAQFTGAAVPSNIFLSTVSPNVVSISLINTKVLGSHCFDGLSLVTELILPATLTGIAEGALRNMSAVTALTLGENLTIVEANAFYNMNSLAFLEFNATDLSDCSADNQIFGSDGQSPAPLAVTVGDNVTKIPSYFFHPTAERWDRVISVTFGTNSVVSSVGKYGLGGLTSARIVNLPSTIQTISAYAFYANPFLASVAFTSVKGSVGEFAFAECPLLTSVSFGSDTLDISESAFENDSLLTSIALGQVLSIGKRAFYNTGLTAVDFPDIITVSESAFERCRNLTSATFGTALTVLSKSVFRSCSSLTSFNAVNGVDSIRIDGLIHTISESAFEGCAAKEQFIGPAVTVIQTRAFYDCVNLTTIDYAATNANPEKSAPQNIFTNAGRSTAGITVKVSQNVTKIPNELFHSILTESESGVLQDLSANVTVLSFVPRAATDSNLIIGDYAFYNLSLTALTIPDFVTGIGAYAFEKNAFLADIDIGTGLTSIGARAFAENTALSTFMFNSAGINPGNFNPSAVGNSDVFYNTGSADGIHVTFGIDITLVYPYMFAIFGTDDSKTNHAKVHTVEFVLGNQCVKIGDSAFSGVRDLSIVTLPSSVSTIGEKAFQSASKLSQINLDNVLTIGSRAFSDCAQLTAIQFDALTSISSGAFNNCLNLNTITLNAQISRFSANVFDSAGTGAANGITVNYNVNRVPDSMFDSEESVAPNVKIVHLSAEKTQIGSRAFRNAKHLTEVNGTLSLIEEYAFYGTTSLNSSINVSSSRESSDPVVTLVGDYAFYQSGISTVTDISNPPADLKSLAFYNIGSYAFANSSLQAFDRSKLLNIGNYAFQNCTSLNFSSFDFLLEKIGVGAFENCSGLDTFFFPRSLKSIGKDAFKNSNLTYVNLHYYKDVLSPTDSWFENGSSLIMGFTAHYEEQRGNLYAVYTISNYISHVGTEAFYGTHITVSYGTNASGALIDGTITLPMQMDSYSVDFEDRCFAGVAVDTIRILGVHSIGSSIFNGCTSGTVNVVFNKDFMLPGGTTPLTISENWLDGATVTVTYGINPTKSA